MPKFTEKLISDFMCPPGVKDRLAFDTIVKGLGVRATASGSRVFLVQWVDPATKRKVRARIGDWGGISLEQARTAARVQLGRVAQGINPKAESAAAKKADEEERRAAALTKVAEKYTLRKLIAEWAAQHLVHLRSRYAEEAQRALRVAFAAHLDRPASALGHSEVAAVVAAYKAAGKAPIASRTIAYGRACFGWATSHRKLGANPFADMPAVMGGTPKRDRVLTDWEVGAIWRAAVAAGEPFGPIVRMLMLTGARRQEMAQARWSEVSDDLASWTIPASRSKNGRPHVVHLAGAAREILATVKRIEKRDLIFGSNERAPSGFSRAKLALDAGLLQQRFEAEQDGPEQKSGWRFHDFRRTLVTWLASNGFPPHIADRLLNHTTGTISGVAAVYQKAEFLPERKSALEAWAAHVLWCGEGRGIAENVVHLRAGEAA